MVSTETTLKTATNTRLVAALDLTRVRLSAIDLAALVHVIETLLSALACFFGGVGVGDRALCRTVSHNYD